MAQAETCYPLPPCCCLDFRRCEVKLTSRGVTALGFELPMACHSLGWN